MEYNKKKLEDMTTDEVVELFTQVVKENIEKTKFNEPFEYPQSPSHYPHNDYPNLKPFKKNKKKVGKRGV